ncbi:hypothetical protein QM716_05265 [Rhodococcus sp. IEGM 1409]|uniref:hypothetical protein n=1 Tax=Rhodococcus sp. IEGM 1409 TaxID=3047082 RepID=UPI0024B7F961|nr:hypothetical protein [Rhodococcus sp. IEGM 1409]MDI9899254.1 hypothetical protein [Rhodococcus sp. IEGM 1409]
MKTTSTALETVEAAKVSADVFGGVSSDPGTRRAAKRRFHRLASAIHPDRARPEDRVRYSAATSRLNELYRSWTAEFKPADSRPVYVGDRGEYALGGLVARGSVANLYRSDAGVVLKIPRNPRANSMIEAERNALTDIENSSDAGWAAPYFPRLIDRITHVDAGTRRQIDVLDDLTEGFVSLADVRAAYPGGLDPPDWAWMHRRLLRALAAAHATGWVHTAITADNVLIEPDRHGVVLVGWSFATRAGSRLLATIGSDRDSYPPERGEAASSAWDIYMAHRLMLRMLGEQTHERMKAFAGGCMQDNPRLRPDAIDLLGEFDELLDLLYGQRTFRPFAVPSTKGQ